MDAKTKEPLSVRLKNELEARNVSVPQFEETTGIPRDRVYKWLKRGTDNIKHEDASIIEAWISNKMDNLPNDSSGIGTKKSGSSEPDWKEFASKMEKLAQSWEHLCDNQRVFIDQIQSVSFNLNKLLLGVSETPEAAVSQLPASAQELLKTGRSGPFQTVGHNEPVGSSDKKGK